MTVAAILKVKGSHVETTRHRFEGIRKRRRASGCRRGVESRPGGRPMRWETPFRGAGPSQLRSAWSPATSYARPNRYRGAP
jgi:hypothetical protein